MESRTVLSGAEFFVVVRTDPFEGIQRTLRQGLEDLILWQGDRGRPERLEHLPGKAADPDLHSREVRCVVDLLAEPSGHLASRVAQRRGDEAAIGQQVVDQRVAAAVLQPGCVLAGVHSERRAGPEDVGRIPVPGVGESGVSAFRLTVGDGVQRVHGGRDVARRMDRHRKMSVRHF